MAQSLTGSRYKLHVARKVYGSPRSTGFLAHGFRIAVHRVTGEIRILQSVQGFDAFNPGSNFRKNTLPQNQNGIVFFPGSSGVYKNSFLVGGFGVSGDGVDQDDVVTVAGATFYGVPRFVLRADQVFVFGVRLPYQKFNRNPEG